jgi:hypothetical protein
MELLMAAKKSTAKPSKRTPTTARKAVKAARPGRAKGNEAPAKPAPRQGQAKVEPSASSAGLGEGSKAPPSRYPTRRAAGLSSASLTANRT